MPQITIKDIAQRLKLSTSTVSRALRNHPDISKATKKKVIALARETGYQPNLIAQSLQNQSSNTIGVIVPEIRHSFFSSAISGIEDVAYQAGYAIMVCQSQESHEREVLNTQALMAHRVAGLLISISQGCGDLRHLRAVRRQGIPLVFFDRSPEGMEASQVVVDDFQGAYEAVRYLINKGYKRIAHLAGPVNINISRQRMLAYKQALQDSQMPVAEDLIISGGFSGKDGRGGMQRLLAMENPPDAVFAVNDPVAIGALKLLKEQGVKVPKDMAIIGFTNDPLAELMDPPLSTVDQPAVQIGREAAALLLDSIKNHDRSGRIITKTLKTRLIIRSSA
jgi:DNA-binding LacI/PurR family transcriptional regulator